MDGGRYRSAERRARIKRSAQDLYNCCGAVYGGDRSTHDLRAFDMAARD